MNSFVWGVCFRLCLVPAKVDTLPFMKAASLFPRRSVVFVTAVIGCVTALAADVKLELLPTGAMPKLGGYLPQRLMLSAEKPDVVRHLPAYRFHKRFLQYLQQQDNDQNREF